jgi:syndecan 4
MNCTNSENGICQQDNTCQCKSGFKGKDCSKPTKNSKKIQGRTISNSEVKEDPFKILSKVTSSRTAEAVKVQSNKKSNIKIPCYNDCSNKGKCNDKTGQCTCENGYGGRDCSLIINKSIVEEKLNSKLSRKNRLEIETEHGSEELDRKLHLDSIYKLGNSEQTWIRTKDCYNDCSSRGICLNSTCLCDQGFSSNDCSLTYKQYLFRGFSLDGMIKYLVLVFFISMAITLIVLLNNRTKRISSANLDALK